MATEVVVPALGESITQAVLVAWHKTDGQTVSVDEAICELETDKANVDIPARAAGVIKCLVAAGDTVSVGQTIAQIQEGVAAATAATASSPVKTTVPAVVAAASPVPIPMPAAANAPSPQDLSPAVRRLVAENPVDVRMVTPTGPGGRITKEDVQNHLSPQLVAPEPPPADKSAEEMLPPSPVRPPPAPAPATGERLTFDSNGIARQPMSKLRQRIAQRLVEAQHTAAILTTFNEIDLTAVLELRHHFKDRFQEVHGVGLGFMSFFARAAVLALREHALINAFIEGADIIHHQYVNLGLAVSTDRGLAVPVLRNVQDMSFARIEGEIKRLATATREGKLSLEELSGGTFTITNGGVFGSLLSTPILNPPQSAILGMHVVQKRAVVIDDKIAIRSMMYVALSYDHRLVDGKEAIGFLVGIKQLLEEPARMMLEI